MLCKKTITALLINILVIISINNNCYAELQPANLVDTLVSIRNNEGDLTARKYLESKYNVFNEPQSNDELLAIFLWCSLTNNLYTSTHDSNYASEYVNIFDSNLRPIFDSDFDLSNFIGFVPVTYYNYSIIKFNENKYDEACEILMKVKSWFDKEPTLKSEFDGYAVIIKDLGTILYRDLHDYNAAIPILTEYLNYIDEASFNYVDACYCIALSYNQKCDYNNAIAYMDKVIALYPKTENYNQANFERIKDEYNFINTNKSGIASDKNFVSDSDTLNLSQCAQLIVSGKVIDALPSLLKLKDIAEKNLPSEQVNYVIICTNLINVYNELSDLDKASKVRYEVLDKIDFKNISDVNIISLFESIGVTSLYLNNYDDALLKFLRAYNIMDKNGISGIEVVKILSNISMCYTYKKDFLSAKWYNDEACEIYEKSGQSLFNGSSYANTLMNNRGQILISLNYLHEAEELYKEIIKNNTQGTDLVLVYNNLSIIYLKLGEWEKAIQLLENLSSDNQIVQLTIDQNLAIVYSQLHDKKVRIPLVKMNARAIDLFCQYFSYFSRSEWENYWDSQASEMLVLNNYLAFNDSSLCDIAFDNLLLSKNMSLISSGFIKDAVMQSNDAEIRQKYKDYLTVKELLTDANVPIDSIANYRQSLTIIERELVSSIPSLKINLNKYFPKWKQIQEALHEDEAVIEFTYTPTEVDWCYPENNVGYYGAYVITKNMELPKIIPLCEIDSLDEIVLKHDFDEVSISSFYSDNKVYKLIFEKLLPSLNNISNIYYAPTGSINSINLEAITINDNQRLGDIYNIKRVSSSAAIINREYESPSLAVLYGGINYDTDVADMIANSHGYINAESQLDLAVRGELNRGSWNYLPGTLDEINEIDSTIQTNYSVSKYIGDNANEESIKLLKFSVPAILHIATHGFYIRNLSELHKNTYISNFYSSSDKQAKLIRTGLLLAGANNVWTGRQEKIQGAEDGILTSAEISNLDLENVQLLVLSACESGRGYIDPIDGVYGLQRAFKQAGVKTIVMSLWKIPDAPTAILMEEFYKNIITGCSPNQALNIAKRELQHKGYTDPYYWASFVVLD